MSQEPENFTHLGVDGDRNGPVDWHSLPPVGPGLTYAFVVGDSESTGILQVQLTGAAFLNGQAGPPR